MGEMIGGGGESCPGPVGGRVKVRSVGESEGGGRLGLDIEFNKSTGEESISVASNFTQGREDLGGGGSG